MNHLLTCPAQCPAQYRVAQGLVKLWVSPRMEITQHLQESWGQFHLRQQSYTNNPIAREAPSSGWAVKYMALVICLWLGCMSLSHWAWKLGLEILIRCAVAIFVRKWSGCQFTPLLESATGLNWGLKEELCACVGLILIPEDWILQPQPRNGSAGNCSRTSLLPWRQANSSLGCKYLNLQRETMRSPIIS